MPNRGFSKLQLIATVASCKHGLLAQLKDWEVSKCLHFRIMAILALKINSTFDSPVMYNELSVGIEPAYSNLLMVSCFH
jgi:hypothetical protein